MTSLLYPYERTRGAEIAAKARAAIVERTLDAERGATLTEYVIMKESDLLVLLQWAELGIGVHAAREARGQAGPTP
ncbi:MAG: hypothetical protein EBZ50_03835 [Alphaproteobacteria bacterium]|nr:hypothetical protein [Alphaproteobacteria bacterium]